MSDANWKALIREFCPKDKRPCNCGSAYETLVKGRASRVNPKTMELEKIDAWVCEYGCSSNQIYARDYIAACIMVERAAVPQSEQSK